MRQPEPLTSKAYQPWSRGRGTDVWAMLRAAADGDLETIRALVSREPGLLECEYQYHKPLHLAVRNNRPAAVQFMLDHGADPLAGGNFFRPVFNPGREGDQSPLAIARDRGYAEVAALLEGRLVERFNIIPAGETVAALIRSRDGARLPVMVQGQPDLVHAADGFGNRPIHWAVMTRQMAIIDLLLARGADINASRPDGARPLDLTNGDYWYRGWRDLPDEAPRKHEVVIGYLLARGAAYDISTAAKLGDLERVRGLLDENPALANRVPDYSGYYNGLPLRCAAAGGHLPVVKLLLERGADPNGAEAVAPRGGALRDAIGGKHWEVVKLLLEEGADPNAMVESSGNCVWAAKRAGASPEILRLLAMRGGVTGLEMACYEGDAQLLATMLDANPALPLDQGAVQSLVGHGQALVELVLRYQPDALKPAVFPGAKTPEYARWLFQRGMDPGRTDWLGVAPLHRFAVSGDRAMAVACLDAGVEINPVDDVYCSTPLGWAARTNMPEMVELLLHRGADPERAGAPWARPLAWAERRGHTQIVATLRAHTARATRSMP